MAFESSGLGSSGATIYQTAANSWRVLSGATLTVMGAGTSVVGAYIEGLGMGGTTNPAMLLMRGSSVASGATVVSAGVVIAADGATAIGGTAYESGSFAAINDGVVSGVTVGPGGGVLASKIPEQGGGDGLVLDPHVLAGGYGLAGGGFTIKGQFFIGPGTISGGTFDVGSTEGLASGGTDIGSIIGGTQVVTYSGHSISSIFSAGTQLLGAGGFAEYSVVSDGGLIEVSGSGAISYRARAGSGGSVRVLESGQALYLQVQAAAAATVEAGGTMSKAIIEGGGTMTVNSGATLASATISGIDASGSGTGGLLIVQSGAVLRKLTIGWKGRIDVDTLSYDQTQKIVYGDNTISIVDQYGAVLWSADVKGTDSNAASDYHLERDPADGSSIIVYDKCFLAGTMIRTDRGEVRVEDLAVGDRVAACVDGGEEYREIRWIGHRSTVVRSWLEDDEAGFPVRILRNALGDNLPHKDLLVTPEHALYLEGAFVPARMLVNGRSIFYDRTLTHFDYYHIETEKHSIIWSDGVPSESYLDTGDRRRFSQESAVVHILNGAALSWEHDAAAPLRTDRAFVQPLHMTFAGRAAHLGIGSLVETPSVTDDPDLHLVDDEGRTIRMMRSVNRCAIFMVPPGIRSVRLVSRVSRPVDVVGAYHDDRRHLGVLVGAIQIWEANETRHIDAHLSDAGLEGWANIEDGRQRWTTGDARLDLSDRVSGAVSILSVEIRAGGPYLARPAELSCGAQAG